MTREDQPIPMPDFSHPEPKQVTRAKNTAAAFRRNDRMEDLVQMRQQRPNDFAALSPHLHIAVGLYEAAKSTYEQITGGTA